MFYRAAEAELDALDIRTFAVISQIFLRGPEPLLRRSFGGFCPVLPPPASPPYWAAKLAPVGPQTGAPVFPPSQVSDPLRIGDRVVGHSGEGDSAPRSARPHALLAGEQADQVITERAVIRSKAPRQGLEVEPPAMEGARVGHSSRSRFRDRQWHRQAFCRAWCGSMMSQVRRKP